MGSSSVGILVILAVLCYICWSFPVPCYFQEYHNKINRDVFPTQSKAKSNCGGDVMTLQEVNKKFEVSPKFLFGAKHVADLILIRTGDFVNWNDKEESRDALSRKICTNHLDELFNKFDKKATKHVKYFHKCEKDVPGCSLPQFISGHHSGQNRVPVNHLTKAESEAVFKTTHQLVQTGIPLCQSCKSWAVDKLKQYQGRKICEEQQTCFTDLNKEIEVDNTCDNDAGNNNGANDIGADGGDFVDDFDDAGDEDYIPPSKAPSDSSPGKQELLTFAHAVGMDTGFGLVGRKPFTSLTRQSQRKKTKGGKILYNEMCSLIAPGSEKVLKQDICLDEMDGWIPNKSTKREEFLRNLSVLYESETDKEFKLHYLSHMVPLVSYVELHQYVTVSPYYYNKATAYA
uniref:Uncharacterized protein n=1 Tax=Panagrolaimus sp. ES5 TaxID=591445 RepID=A0AC34G441_9BILA